MKLHNALVRPPSASFADGLTRATLGPPDLAGAVDQHAAYCRALVGCGLEVTHLPSVPHHPDATFVEDTAILTERGAILTRPGAPSRAGEVETIRPAIAEFFPRLDEIVPPGTVDGGDVCEAGERFLIGISERTNEHGARQLVAFLQQLGYQPSLVDIRGVAELLHLKSGLAWLGGDRIAAIGHLAGHAALADFEIVPVIPAETYAANCIPVNGRLLVASGFPVFETTLRRLGYDVLTLGMSEFRKMDGGLSCLSLRF